MLLIFPLFTEELLQSIYEVELKKIQELTSKVDSVFRKITYAAMGFSMFTLMVRDNLLLTIENALLYRELAYCYNYYDNVAEEFDPSHTEEDKKFYLQIMKYKNRKKERENEIRKREK